jgi:sugar-specific transcriptional regulator TrmB
MDLFEAFKTIGFTKQETTLYLTLCEHGEISGYEAAKLSGISRSNTYASLSTLVEKGGAYIVEGQPTKYLATPKKELLINAKRWFENVTSYIEQNVVFNTPQNEAYVSILGYNHIVNKVCNMLSLTNNHLYFSADSTIIDLFLDKLIKLAEDKKVVILCDKQILAPHIICYQTDTKSSFKLIVDTQIVLTGTLEQCLYSKNQTLVQLIRETMTNEIKLIQYER